MPVVRPAVAPKTQRPRAKTSLWVALWLCLCSSAAAASLTDRIRAGDTHIELTPGVHNFSGANVTESLTMVGASAGKTIVQCSGAFSVTGELVVHNLTIRGCQEGCSARLGGVIRADSGRVFLRNVHVRGGVAGAGGAFYCGGAGSLDMQRVNLTGNTAQPALGGGWRCHLSWTYGYRRGLPWLEPSRRSISRMWHLRTSTWWRERTPWFGW